MATTVSEFLVDAFVVGACSESLGTQETASTESSAPSLCQRQPALHSARHEELAAFMACAHAKFTGEVGVCIATSGPGAIHLLNGLDDAKLDHQPVVAIVGQQKAHVAGKFLSAGSGSSRPLQGRLGIRAGTVAPASDADLRGHRIPHRDVAPRSARSSFRLIFRKSRWKTRREHGVTYSGVGYSAPRIIPEEDDLRKAADVLNAGKKVAMLVCAGALHATDEVIETADALGAGTLKHCWQGRGPR